MNTRPKHLLAISILVLVVLAVITLFALAKPKAVIVFKGGHNPRTTYVSVGDRAVDPGGKDGREYTVLGVGKKSVSINGPLLETTSVDVSVPIFGTSRIELEAKPVEVDALIRAELNQKDAVVSKQKVFAGSWVVGYVGGVADQDENGSTSRAVFLYFDRKSTKWQPITPETVELLESAPKEARYYYESLLED